MNKIAVILLNYNSSNDCRHCVESLKKQMPQKVTHEATLMRDTTCSRCKNIVGSYIDFNGIKTQVQYQYCCYCGQALDWSEENE